MKPASAIEDALIASALVGVIHFYLYSQSQVWLGAVFGVGLGLATFILLRASRINPIRNTVIISFSILTWISFSLILNHLSLDFIWSWSVNHRRIDLMLATKPMRGATMIPDPLTMNQLVLGVGVPRSIGFEVLFPVPLEILATMVGLYVVAFIAFGSGWCGWMCPLGGLADLFSIVGKKRWVLSGLREKFTYEGVTIPAGVKKVVRYVKYIVLLIMLTISIASIRNISGWHKDPIYPFTSAVEVFCWTNLFLHPIILWVAFGAVLTLFVVLPFMTKRRWCFAVCPVSAVTTPLGRISPFTVKIDQRECTKCYECVEECPTYSMTPQLIEESGMPNLDCNKCTKCMDVCPQEVIDIYLRGTPIKARTFITPLLTLFTALWYVWLAIAIVQLAPSLLGI